MITSIHNPKIQRVRELIQRRSRREEEQAFVIEGARLIQEARQSGITLDLVLISSQPSPRATQLAGDFVADRIAVEEVSAELFNRISDTDNPQGILAIARQQPLPLPPCWDFLVIADGLRDPGNLGTLLRTSAAAGADAIILTPQCADVYSPKVVRAGMGAHFKLAILHKTWQEIMHLCHSRPEQPAQLLVSDAENGAPCWQLNLRQPLALVIGSEAEGVSSTAQQAADQRIMIPMPGQVESLNAAVAAGILLFEVVRQRYT